MEPQKEGPSGFALLFAWSAALLLVGLLGGLGLGRTLWGTDTPPEPPKALETCIIGSVGLPDGELGLRAIFGEQELCFTGMRWSPVYGPTMPGSR